MVPGILFDEVVDEADEGLEEELRFLGHLAEPPREKVRARIRMAITIQVETTVSDIGIARPNACMVKTVFMLMP